jgi:coenzyme F420-0:L-glutamate ligase/coenzyme F420-1:gamma-L-glutamate ligase
MITGKTPPKIELIGIQGIPAIKEGDDLPGIIYDAAERQKTPLENDDIVVVTSKVVSLAEGRTVDFGTVEPSRFAKTIANDLDKDPRQVEVVLRETKSIVRMAQNHLIVETRHGFVCANAGVDKSNVKGENIVCTLPENPDLSSRKIREGLKKIGGINVAVLISDTFGRSLRAGVANVAIGVAGLSPILDYRGKTDMYGYKLRVTQIAVADELAASAELVMGKTNWIPAVIVRGYAYKKSEKSTAKELILKEKQDIFR